MPTKRRRPPTQEEAQTLALMNELRSVMLAYYSGPCIQSNPEFAVQCQMQNFIGVIQHQPQHANELIRDETEYYKRLCHQPSRSPRP